jgi:hypothetical protein
MTFPQRHPAIAMGGCIGLQALDHAGQALLDIPHPHQRSPLNTAAFGHRRRYPIVVSQGDGRSRQRLGHGRFAAKERQASGKNEAKARL